jgi:hypothetical protein
MQSLPAWRPCSLARQRTVMSSPQRYVGPSGPLGDRCGLAMGRAMIPFSELSLSPIHAGAPLSGNRHWFSDAQEGKLCYGNFARRRGIALHWRVRFPFAGEGQDLDPQGHEAILAVLAEPTALGALVAVGTAQSLSNVVRRSITISAGQKCWWGGSPRTQAEAGVFQISPQARPARAATGL